MSISNRKWPHHTTVKVPKVNVRELVDVTEDTEFDWNPPSPIDWVDVMPTEIQVCIWCGKDIPEGVDLHECDNPEDWEDSLRSPASLVEGAL